MTLPLYTTERHADVSKHILLDANEHYRQWVKIPAHILTKLHRYPDRLAVELRAALSQQYCFPFSPDNLFISAGSIEAIDLLIQALKPKCLALSSPTYDVYEQRAIVHGVRVLKVPFRKDGQPNPTLLTGQNNKADMIILINPNNPTGDLVEPETIRRILKKFKGTIVIDEAYIEFAGLDKSLQDFAFRYPNVVVLRTFSKAWGLAGVRLGYVIASPEVVKLLEAYQNPYSVSSIALFSGICALEQKDQLSSEVAKTLSLKRQLIDELEKSGIAAKDSAANFISLEISDASKVSQYLREHGVLTRQKVLTHRGSDGLRVTIGSEEDLIAFERVIKEAMRI